MSYVETIEFDQPITRTRSRHIKLILHYEKRATSYDARVTVADFKAMAPSYIAANKHLRKPCIAWCEMSVNPANTAHWEYSAHQQPSERRGSYHIEWLGDACATTETKRSKLDTAAYKGLPLALMCRMLVLLHTRWHVSTHKKITLEAVWSGADRAGAQQRLTDIYQQYSFTPVPVRKPHKHAMPMRSTIGKVIAKCASHQRHHAQNAKGTSARKAVELRSADAAYSALGAKEEAKQSALMRSFGRTTKRIS